MFGNQIATRYPLAFAVAIMLAGFLSLLWPFWLPGWPLVVQVLAGRISICLLAVGLLTYLRWWREVGFVKPTTWGIWVPYLPLLLPVLLNATALISSGSGGQGWEFLLLGLLTYGLGGFFEEAVFRGLVFRTLRPGGIISAAVLTSVLFGAVHALNLLMGADPTSTVFQMVAATLIGFGYVGVLGYTHNLWPAVVIHGATNLVAYLTAGGFVNMTATSAAPTPAEWAGMLIVSLPIAIYALWLLRRATRDSKRIEGHLRTV